MDDLTVVQANELIDASYSLSLNEIRLISLAATKVDSRHKNCGDIKVYVSDFMAAYNVSYSEVYGQIRDAVKSIMRKPIKIYNPDNNEVMELAWLMKNKYSIGDDGAYVVMSFSPLIEPYLFELKERFTKIEFKYAARLNTPFSFRLYQWLKKAENLNSHKKRQAISIVLNIQWMKEQAQLVGKYSAWRDFKRYVIEPALDRINSQTDISVTWEPIKQGRSISAINFFYVVEKRTFAKPIRPRLHRRPKVVKGSHEEGGWMRKNLALLLSYKDELKNHDSEARLHIKDIERIAEYSSICDRVTHQKALKELAERRAKKRKYV